MLSSATWVDQPSKRECRSPNPAQLFSLTQTTFRLEIYSSIGEVTESYKNVDKWVKPERAPFNMNWFAMKPTTYKEPKGTVLIISPFNYPVWLLLGPLAGAIAAGNTVLLKPSESTPAWSSLIVELVAKYLDPDLVAVVNGAVPETTKVLELPWDHSSSSIIHSANLSYLTETN